MMLDERTASLNVVIAVLLWAATAATIVAAGVVMYLGYWHAAVLTAEAACCLSAFAAVRHIRCYACSIIRKIEDDRELTADIRRLTGMPGQRTR